MKNIVIALCLLALVGCAVGPQSLKVSPQLDFAQLNGVTVPIELVVSDQRENTELLGYRNAKNQGPISFEASLAKSVGESLQAAMVAQNIEMRKGPEPLSKLEVTIVKLHYFSPDESWVNHIELEGEIVVKITRSGSSLTKRFAANRAQDVATAPAKEFNENYLNTMLSELFNKALNDKEIVNFLK
ncbi:YajG family lipoprotein [Bermanella sp. WJH001]|uniref:YajG family lipoprotein n=1 Tax=Bermanella sp. WJH001 TaxID=3048005 RepID=UPI0024BD5CBA|nr:YajG family lipoprotein [Bermanella sp. WJH001]MDJ1537201.1 YajG family lipoprotein [Bermanella sp. WJH001]